MIVDPVLGYALGILGSVVLFLFLLPLWPGLIDRLTNRPNKYRGTTDTVHDDLGTAPDHEKSDFGYFTYIEPEKVKIIERGDLFKYAIMKSHDKMFLGEDPASGYTIRDVHYWEVVPSIYSGGSDPIPFPTKRLYGIWTILWIFYSPLSILFWLWKEWVYWLTGAVFTGIYPFQKVRTYPLEHFKKITQSGGEIELRRLLDWSDHYRVGDFQFPLRVPAADTKDKIPVEILVNAIARVFNPHLTAYNSDDDWGTRLIATISDSVTHYTRPRPLEAVLSAESPALVRELEETILNENGRIIRGVIMQGAAVEFGIALPSVQVLDISPSDKSRYDALGDLAIARIDRQAMEERAKGKAADIREQGEALKTHPGAEAIPHIEGMVRAAKAAGEAGGMVILPGTSGPSVDPVQVAILDALRNPDRRNRTSGTTPPQGPDTP